MELGPWGIPSRSEAHNMAKDVSLFSSSLPVLHREKLNLLGLDSGLQSADGKNEVEKGVADDFDLEKIGSMLPDDEEELLAGIMDDFDLNGLPSQVDEVEDYDVFGVGGGLELDFDHAAESLSMSMANTSISDGFLGNGTAQFGAQHNLGSTVFGEHPFGEHPSRTLFVRNINSNVEDSELRTLFEQYGDIRTLYTACKHRGFVMISYYDIRAARMAMRALQNKPLRRRKLDIHFSIPKDNPSDKDINQGTLVAFNLDPSVSNDDLDKIFGVYGEVKEIRETPHKRHHKFIEFYDVRAAEAALRSLNRSDIAGKRIKLEPSRPGGARRNLIQQLSHEIEQSESKGFRHPVGSPIASSPPGTWLQFGSPTDNGLVQALSHSPTLGGSSAGLASILPPPIGKDHIRLNHPGKVIPGPTGPTQHGVPLSYSHSFPDLNPGMMPGSSQDSAGNLSRSHILWPSPGAYSSAWSTQPNGQSHVFPFSDRRGSLLGSSLHHNVGSAPTGFPLESYFGYSSESPDTPFMNSMAFGGLGVGPRKEGSLMMNMGPRSGAAVPRAPLPAAPTAAAASAAYRMMPMQRLSPIFLGTGSYTGFAPGSGFEGLLDRGRSRRAESSASQSDNKRQYHLELQKIISGEDTRTTLMIKNIPNKYTSKMLLAAIDESHKGTYDFFYLPIDFKNKCNVGYAFINMVSPSHIPSFYETFNGKKWEKFNSEKVASLAYARIQGKSALITHFQNSSLMNEDKRCHPILFHSAGPEAGSQEPFPPGHAISLGALPQGVIAFDDEQTTTASAAADVIAGRQKPTMNSDF
ncbi:MEI2-like protein 5 isoform X2 [Wolffia australiana]